MYHWWKRPIPSEEAQLHFDFSVKSLVAGIVSTDDVVEDRRYH
jgi:hypothetical protein